MIVESLKRRSEMNEIDIVRDTSRRFERANSPYMLTGSMAMSYYAQPRMTPDIDIVIAIGPEDVNRVAALFRPDYYLNEENIRESIACESIFNLIHHESVIKVDCIIRKSSEHRRTEFERRQKIAIDDFTTFIVNKEDLIISKLFWGKGFASRSSIGECAKSARDWVRHRLPATLDAQAGAGYSIGRMPPMTDTPPEIERMLHDKLMARSNEERFIMDAQMFESAREMVKAALPPSLSEIERRRELFRRTYGKETGLEKRIWI